MPAWVQAELAADDELRAQALELEPLVLISQVNRAYHLAEPLRKTAGRPWWDILAWELALVVEQDLMRSPRA